MKASNTLLLLTPAAFSTAQLTKNSNGTYTCALAQGSYCLSTSLTSSTIIRCSNYIGTASSCDTRLADKAPLGESYSPCWQTSTISGNALCSKNGIVYPDGNNTTPYPVPNYQYISASISSVATADTTQSTTLLYKNLSTSTTTTTRTNFLTSTSTLYLQGLPTPSTIFQNTSAPFSNTTLNTTSLYPFNANANAALAAPISKTYTTSQVYIYTTICPAGLTITDSSGSETILPTPTTLTLTGTTVSTTGYAVKTANIGLAAPRKNLEGDGEPVWGWVNSTIKAGPTAAGHVAPSAGIVGVLGTTGAVNVAGYVAPSAGYASVGTVAYIAASAVTHQAIAPFAITHKLMASSAVVPQFVAPSAARPQSISPFAITPHPMASLAVTPQVIAPHAVENIQYPTSSTPTTMSIISSPSSQSASSGWSYKGNITNIMPYTGAAAAAFDSESIFGLGVAAVVAVMSLL